MDADAEQVCAWIKGSEGGFVNNPHDRGGATNFGVTIAELKAWRGHAVTVQDVKDLSWNEAKTILQSQYMTPVHFDELPAGLDYSVADESFNSGPVRAIQTLQKVLGVSVDGHYGVVTSAAVIDLKDIPAVIRAYNAARLGWLHTLADWVHFGTGWGNRVALVLKRSLGMAKGLPASVIAQGEAA